MQTAVNESAVDLDPSARSAVFIAAAQYGGPAAYNALLARYRAASVATEQRRVLSALSAAATPDLIARTLALCMSARRAAAIAMRAVWLTSVAGAGRCSHTGRAVLHRRGCGTVGAWALHVVALLPGALRRHPRTVRSPAAGSHTLSRWCLTPGRFGDGGFGISTLVERVVGRFSSEAAFNVRFFLTPFLHHLCFLLTHVHLQDAAGFFSSHELRGARRAVVAAEEEIRGRARWLRVNYEPVAAWLTQT
jgi:hypothetical protein